MGGCDLAEVCDGVINIARTRRTLPADENDLIDQPGEKSAGWIGVLNRPCNDDQVEPFQAAVGTLVVRPRPPGQGRGFMLDDRGEPVQDLGFVDRLHEAERVEPAEKRVLRRDLANALLRAAWSATLGETRVLLLDLLIEVDQAALEDSA